MLDKKRWENPPNRVVCLHVLLRGIGMKIDGHLDGNQKDEVCSNLHHSFLNGLLADFGSPGGGVGGEGTLHSFPSLLLSVGTEESL